MMILVISSSIFMDKGESHAINTGHYPLQNSQIILGSSFEKKNRCYWCLLSYLFYSQCNTPQFPCRWIPFLKRWWKVKQVVVWLWIVSELPLSSLVVHPPWEGSMRHTVLVQYVLFLIIACFIQCLSFVVWFSPSCFEITFFFPFNFLLNEHLLYRLEENNWIGPEWRGLCGVPCVVLFMELFHSTI